MRKRKMVVEDSDDDMSPKDPIPYKTVPGRSKKPRMSAVFSDVEDDEEDASEVTSFAKRLTKYQKSPSKATGRGVFLAFVSYIIMKNSIYAGRKRSEDDDDFIVPDDIDEEEEDDVRASSRASSSRASSRLSSRSTAFDDLDDEDEDDEDDKPKARKKVPARPALKKDASSKGGSTSFLTAAEQRARQQKEDKKSTEDPFSFLVDPKDKEGVRPGEPGYDPRTLYIPTSAWKTFTPFEKQFWEIKQNHYDTILFFQKGKFLELYEEDARIGHQEFDLKLTHRVKMSMVGVELPHCASNASY